MDSLNLNSICDVAYLFRVALLFTYASNLPNNDNGQGLDIGQFIALRGELDGETLMGYFR